MKNKLLVLSLIPAMIFASGCTQFEEIFGDQIDGAMVTRRDFRFDKIFDDINKPSFLDFIESSYEYANSIYCENVSIDYYQTGQETKSLTIHDEKMYKDQILISNIKSYKKYLNNSYITTSEEYKEAYQYIGESVVNTTYRENTKTRLITGVLNPDTFNLRTYCYYTAVNGFLPFNRLTFGVSGGNLYGLASFKETLTVDTIPGSLEVSDYYFLVDLGTIDNMRLNSIEFLETYSQNYSGETLYEDGKQKVDQVRSSRYRFGYDELKVYEDYEGLTSCINHYVLNDYFLEVLDGDGADVSYVMKDQMIDDNNLEVKFSFMKKKYQSISISFKVSVIQFPDNVWTNGYKLNQADNVTLPEELILDGEYLVDKSFVDNVDMILNATLSVKFDGLAGGGYQEYNVVITKA